MPLKTTRFDILDHLKTEEDCVLYLEACRQEAGDDSVFMARAMADAARARKRLRPPES